MICPMCKGERTVFTREQPGVVTQFGEIKLVVCPTCNGTGEIEMTNEEWLKSMTTEELAEWIYRAMFYKSCQKDVADGAYMQMMTKKDYIENWLLEIHYE